MPTGYTAAIGTEEGLTFRQYTERCAHAFMVSLRDDPIDSPIPDEFPDETDYYRKELHKREMRISRLRHATPNQLRSQMLRELQRDVRYADSERRRALKLRGRYANLMTQAALYQAPTPDHVNFQKFMIDQLLESAKYDCNTEYYDEKDKAAMDALRTLTPEQWRDRKIEEYQNDLAYYQKHLREAKERSQQRQDWVRNLKRSLEEHSRDESVQAIASLLE